jgi:predicted GIY-YIG superfamily endonuclease
MGAVRTRKQYLSEPMVMQQELEQLKALKKTISLRIKRLTKQLDEVGVVPTSYLAKEIHLYALELEDGNYYVGMSRNPESRMARHLKGKGAQWTRKHKPLRIVETRSTGLTDDSEVARLEDDMTIQYAQQYGHDKVRGGSFCAANPYWPEEVEGGQRNWHKVPDWQSL